MKVGRDRKRGYTCDTYRLRKLSVEEIKSEVGSRTKEAVAHD